HRTYLSPLPTSLLHLLLSYFSLSCSADLRDLHSFPTRRSSDLGARIGSVDGHGRYSRSCAKCPRDDETRPLTPSPRQTRKGTSHPRFRKKEQGRGTAEPPLRPYRSPLELQELGPVTCHTYFHSGASSAARRIARTR